MMKVLETRIPPLALVMIFAVLMGLLHWLGWGQMTNFPGLWAAIGIFVIGAVVTLWGVIAFRLAKTTVDPRDPRQSSTLVDTGIYAFSRNPMYLGFLCWLLALALYLQNAGALLLCPLFVLYMNRFQIQPEERALKSLFGEPYRDYMRRVRRWF
ncbi:isoprenylcysteine carboxylmethyltransferase family protein [Aliiglaciecola sp. CAU 1673]|uniref:methyltransferase family protein n=1 Tax=Aliiglaciecola sp. CAU 1673 TaxID=3032595 RepID=UPI0023DB09CB|nr:isoprenylcysteine carboxylmethyltransferase family protein [Aliiglaciecola sp. CAU 1673]MDF2177253.1 isoprenylcysteine carboxylmethyltransferase family protein [Aliiglaciecola sp. CAU 1673]